MMIVSGGMADAKNFLFDLKAGSGGLFMKVWPCSIGHPPHSSASPVELRLRVGPRALSGKKKNLGNRGCWNLSVCNAPKGNNLGVRK
jgi:hypothetical protein